MSKKSLLSVIAVFYLLGCLITIQIQCTSIDQTPEQENTEPIIGILTQVMSSELKSLFRDTHDYYIPASYVKFIESSGSRVIPIWTGMNSSYYKNVMVKINGVLLPGDAGESSLPDEYIEAAGIIYRLAVQLNEKDHYFPILGIGTGSELLIHLIATDYLRPTECSINDRALPLRFDENVLLTRMFRHSDDHVLTILGQKPVTVNSDGLCFTTENLGRYGLLEKIAISSTSMADDGSEFVSSFEHVILPFYGLQFHPEAILYEWKRGRQIPRGQEAISANQHFADFFVGEARKSDHSFLDLNQKNQQLIYNFDITFEPSTNLSVQQFYFFTKKDRRFVNREGNRKRKH